MKSYKEALEYKHVIETAADKFGNIEPEWVRVLTNGERFVISDNREDYEYGISKGWKEAKEGA